MLKYFLFILLFFSFNSLGAMEKPYHHIYKDGKLFAFRNLEGGPKRDPNFKWNWKVFREEKKKLKKVLQAAEPSEYFGQDFTKMGELIELMQELDLVKGDKKMAKKMKSLSENNVDVVASAAKLRKEYEQKGYSFKSIQKLVNDFVATIDETLTRITAMKEVELTKEQQIEFAKTAALLRFTEKAYNEENISKVVDLDDLLSYERKEDEGNGLWEVYNRVQESLVQGKFHYIGGNKKSRKARPIKNFKQSIHVNQKLSELAFAYV